MKIRFRNDIAELTEVHGALGLFVLWLINYRPRKVPVPSYQ